MEQTCGYMGNEIVRKGKNMEGSGKRRIVVTGASSGIGAQTAVTLSKQGADVILIARRKEKLEETLSGLQSGDHDYYCVDVSEISAIEETVRTIVTEHGRIDGLVYAAGVAGDMPLRQLTYEKQISVFKVNYFAFTEFVRQVSKKGRFNSGMRIVSVSSVAACFGEKAHLAYAASKAAMNAAVRCMAKELAPKGIGVNAVAPGWVRTDMADEFVKRNGADSNAVQHMLDRQFLGMGQPADIAQAVAFLLSPAAGFITGTTLFADGGYSVS